MKFCIQSLSEVQENNRKEVRTGRGKGNKRSTGGKESIMNNLI